MSAPHPASRPPRILLLESGTGPGGSVNFLRDFAMHVDRARLSPVVGLYGPNPSKSLVEIERLGVPVRFFSTAKAPSFSPGVFDTWLRRLRPIRTAWRLGWRTLAGHLPLAWKIRNFIRRERIEVVVLNQDVHFHVPGALGARWAGVPCICRKAGGIGDALRLKRILNRWVDLFVSISKATEDDQRRTPGTKRLINLYEGLDLTRFASLPLRRDMRRELGVPDGNQVVATISRMETGKGQIEFIRMAARIVAEHWNVTFLVAGDRAEDAPFMRELKELARSLDVEHHFVFAGWREDVPAVLTAVDIFVHCPTTFIEGLARTCLEAMAVGVPQVVSENGGLPDAVLDGISGFVVKPGDIEAMAQSVSALLADETLAAEFGRQGRRRVEQVFDMAANGRALQDVLLEYARPAEVAAVAGERVGVALP